MANHITTVSNKSQDAPSISVVIPLYNKVDTVARALNSVLAQTVRDFEIIVVNDGSTDGSERVVDSFATDRIRLIHQTNQGVSAARNLGIRWSRSNWIAFLDADDTWETDHLEMLLGLRNDYPEADVCAMCYLYGVEGEGTRLPIIRGLPANWRGILFDYFSLAARSDPPLWTSAVSVKRTSIDAIGGFPVGTTAGEDLLTWARLAVRTRIAYCMKATAIFWQRSGHLYCAPPIRIPHRDDVVGRGLHMLLTNCRAEEIAGIRKYIALWHKMRASIYLRLGARAESLKEIIQAIRYDPFAWKLYAYPILALLPTYVRNWIVLRYAANLRP